MYLSVSAPQRIFFPQPLTRVETGRARGGVEESHKKPYVIWSGMSRIERAKGAALVGQSGSSFFSPH